MINIGICDDDIKTVQEVKKLLYKIKSEKMIDMNVRTYTDAMDFQYDLVEGITFDLIYLDIEMEGKNGIDLAKFLRSKDKEVIIIYISNYENYLKELLEVEPFRFISKPIDPVLFNKYFILAFDKILNSELYFYFKFNKEFYKVAIKDIIYFESKGRRIYIKLLDSESVQFYGQLNSVERQMDKIKACFLRIHQSFLINYKYIKRLSFTEVELYDGEVFHISLERQKRIRKKACNIMGEEQWN